MNIDAGAYELFSNAIYHVLMGGKGLTYTQMVEGIKDCFQQRATKFNGSIGWYTVTIKNDMEARGIISVSTEGGKKLHRLASKEKALKTRRDR